MKKRKVTLCIMVSLCILAGTGCTKSKPSYHSEISPSAGITGTGQETAEADNKTAAKTGSPDNAAGDTSSGTAASDKAVTKWELKPSFKYDVLCFLNTLVGDEYYLRYYRKEYEDISKTLTPKVKELLESFKQIRKEKQIIIGSALAYAFSQTKDETLDDMINTLSGNGTDIWEQYYTADEDKPFFDKINEGLIGIFNFLEEIDFEKYWETNMLPGIEKRIDEINAMNPSEYDILPEVEKCTGISLNSDTITIYLLYFAQPHGIRIKGTNLLSDISYSFDTIIGTAVHEMLHPPFNPEDAQFKAARSKLEEDEFIKSAMDRQDKTHGYETYEAYFEENCVDALEVLLREKYDILGEDARSYFRNHDGGIDALGMALYQLMKQEDFINQDETYQDFIIRNINSGELAPGKIKELNKAFFEQE